MIPRDYGKRQPRSLRSALAPVLLPLPYQDAVARFDRVLVALHRSADTRRLYLSAVRHWLAAGGAPGHLDTEALARYLAGLRERLAPASVNVHIKALRAFYRVQADWGAASADEARKVPRQQRVPHRLTRFLLPEQIGEVLGTLPLDTFTGVRDFTIIRLIFETGMRAGEMAQLELGSLLDDGTVFVRGKGGRDRYAPIGDEMRGTLDGYLHARRTLRPGKKVALWLARTGRPLANGRSIWEIVHRRLWLGLGRRGGYQAVERSGRPWRGHYPHELRASFATAMMRGGCPITAIAQMMGHANVATTALYLGVDLDYLRGTLALHPRFKRAPEPHALPDSPADGIPTSPAGLSTPPAPAVPIGTARRRSSW